MIKPTRITLRILRDFAGMGKHGFRIEKLNGAISVHTLRDWDGKGSDGPELFPGDRLTRTQADDLTEQKRYEVTVIQ